jgi:hypothetical protein
MRLHARSKFDIKRNVGYEITKHEQMQIRSQDIFGEPCIV